MSKKLAVKIFKKITKKSLWWFSIAWSFSFKILFVFLIGRWSSTTPSSLHDTKVTWHRTTVQAGNSIVHQITLYWKLYSTSIWSFEQSWKLIIDNFSRDEKSSKFFIRVQFSIPWRYVFMFKDFYLSSLYSGFKR